jgi:hypothetical protein
VGHGGLPAIAEQDESHMISTPFVTHTVSRRAGEALHPEREPLEVLNHLRRTLGVYNSTSAIAFRRRHGET